MAGRATERDKGQQAAGDRAAIRRVRREDKEAAAGR